jgi:hypothetical protein
MSLWSRAPRLSAVGWSEAGVLDPATAAVRWEGGVDPASHLGHEGWLPGRTVAIVPHGQASPLASAGRATEKASTGREPFIARRQCSDSTSRTWLLGPYKTSQTITAKRRLCQARQNRRLWIIVAIVRLATW